MNILQRYIIREMLASIVLAVLVCSGLLLLGNLLKEILALLMAGQATLGLVFRAIGLLIPFVVTFALPMGTLTAALLVFGRLSADQELTAARANGVSLLSLALPALLLSLGLCGLCAWINMDLGPRCRDGYKELLFSLARTQARTLITPGRFITDFPGFVIYADRVQGDDLEDVLFFQIKDGRKIRDIRAPEAHLALHREKGEMEITFKNGRLLEWVARAPEGTNEVSGAEAASGFWQQAVTDVSIGIGLPPEVRQRLPTLSDMTFRQLLSERRELLKLGVEEVTPLDVQIHRQVAFSFAAFGFTLIGVPLGVRAHRRETSVGVAVAIGLVLVYYGFLVVAQALETETAAAPWMIVWLPNFLFQGLGAWLLWRANRGK